MENKVILPYKVGNAINLIKELTNEQALYKIETLMSRYKSKNTSQNLQEAINTVVEFIRKNSRNRKDYFAALVNGFETSKPSYYGEFTQSDKEDYFDKFIESVKPYFFSDDTSSLSFRAFRDTCPIPSSESGISIKLMPMGLSIILDVNGGSNRFNN